MNILKKNNMEILLKEDGLQISIENNRVIIEKITQKNITVEKPEIIVPTQNTVEEPKKIVGRGGKPIRFYYTGKVVRDFPSLSEAAKFFKVDPAAIYRSMKNTGKFRHIRCEYI